MSWLVGGEKSGTPMETRAGTKRVAGDLLNPSGGRLSSGASGIGLGGLNTGGISNRMFEDPGDSLRGLFAALEPLQRRQTDEAVAGVRSGFGRLGSRFSRGAGEAEAQTRGELAGGFARSREQSILDAEGQQMQLLSSVLQALLGARGQTLDFFRPGAPNFQEGSLGDIIGAAGNVAAAGRA